MKIQQPASFNQKLYFLSPYAIKMRNFNIYHDQFLILKATKNQSVDHKQYGGLMVHTNNILIGKYIG